MPATATKAELAAAHAAQGHFDFAMPWGKLLLNTREVARAIGREQDYVRQLVESGRLEAHQDSAFGERKSSLVTRRSVLVYLAETATYEPRAMQSRLEALVDDLTRPQLEALLARATAALSRKP